MDTITYQVNYKGTKIQTSIVDKGICIKINYGQREIQRSVKDKWKMINCDHSDKQSSIMGRDKDDRRTFRSAVST
jgi:hypothetical protein